MIFFLFFGLLILGIFSLAMYWIFKNKLRARIFLGVVGALILFGIINEIFFTDHSMQFLPSKAYPGMFLIKNIDVTDDALQKIIKNKVNQEVKRDFIPNRKKYLHYYPDSTKADYGYHLRYYKYTDDDFGIGIGTSYFLDHQEDDGGPTSIYFLDSVEKDKIADFWINTYYGDPERYHGIFQWHNSYKNDTIKITPNP